MRLQLDTFTSTYNPGRNKLVQLLWYVTSLLLFESGWFILRKAKLPLLRLFGAKIGKGVVIKPNVRIKYPWRLTVGDHSWIGQEVWIDNFSEVTIGSHVCISQGVYFCTGSHDHRKSDFPLIHAPVFVKDSTWVGARSTILGGCTIGEGSIVGAMSLVNQDIDGDSFSVGVPARNKKALDKNPLSSTRSA